MDERSGIAGGAVAGLSTLQEISSLSIGMPYMSVHIYLYVVHIHENSFSLFFS